MLNIKKFYFNPLRETTLLLWDESLEAVIIDPGCSSDGELSRLCGTVEKEGLHPKAILLTHGHVDHVAGVAPLARKYGIPVYMSEADASILATAGLAARAFGLDFIPEPFDSLPLEDGQTISFGGSSLKVIATPGHTPGSVCFLDEADGVLISGDTLFAGSIGRTDLPGGDYDKLIVSIMDTLMGLPGQTDVIPGHGPVTDIGYERTHNPFLQPFNEPVEEEDGL